MPSLTVILSEVHPLFCRLPRLLVWWKPKHPVHPQPGVHVRLFTQITLQCPAVHDSLNRVLSISTHRTDIYRYHDLGDLLLTIALMSLAIGPTA